MSIFTTVLSNLKTEVTTILVNELKTNPQLSQAAATVAVMRGVDALLGKLGPIGIFAEAFVIPYINLEVPVIYAQLVKDLAGTSPGSSIIAGQNEPGFAGQGETGPA